jgi:GNAT superfamily N-acetyltransferase
MIFLTPADARRMEAAEELGALSFARAAHQQNPGQGVAWEPFGGGHLIFVAKDAPVGRAHGLGFAGKVTDADIERVEQFYFQRDAAAQVDVCPYADPSLFEVLNQRGFQVVEFNQTLARWIDPEERFGAALNAEGIEIRQVRPQEAGDWSGLLSRIFFGDEAADFQELFTPWAATDNPLCLAALVDGRMIAGAGGMLVPEHRMAAFFGAATLAQYRGRGLQMAFMQERLRIAQQAGCDLAVTLTMPGTTSQRNVERAGFRVAYTKVVVGKAPPAQGQ